MGKASSLDGVSGGPRAGPTAGAIEGRDYQRETPDASHRASSVGTNRDVRFHMKIHNDTGHLILEMRDNDTGEVIRQIPLEALLETGQRLEDLRGILVDEQA
jgi:uncharacterized FlaG/YvyC family protein